MTYNDVGDFELEFWMTDDNYTTSFANNYYKINIHVEYTAPTINPDDLLNSTMNSTQEEGDTEFIYPTINGVFPRNIGSQQDVDKAWGEFNRSRREGGFFGPDFGRIDIWIEKITHEGFVHLKFNQLLLVPFFDPDPWDGPINKVSYNTSGHSSSKDFAMDEYSLLKHAERNSTRRLISLSQLNVTRDVLILKYKLRSDVAPERIVYDLRISEWRSDGMVLHANFSEPEVVSIGLNLDLCYVKILNEYLFISESSGIMLEHDYQTLVEEWPKQYPFDPELEKVKNMANMIALIMQIAVALLALGTFLFFSNVSDIWTLIYAT